MFEDRKSEEFLEHIRSEMSAMDDDIVEPDWDEFRSSVRNRLLSRSVQRSSAGRRWKLAWAFSLLAVIAVATGVIWNVRPTNEGAATGVHNYAAQPAVDISEWPQTGLFDDLVQLGDSEEEQLRQMLEAAQ